MAGPSESWFFLRFSSLVVSNSLSLISFMPQCKATRGSQDSVVLRQPWTPASIHLACCSPLTGCQQPQHAFCSAVPGRGGGSEGVQLPSVISFSTNPLRWLLGTVTESAKYLFFLYLYKFYSCSEQWVWTYIGNSIIIRRRCFFICNKK